MSNFKRLLSGGAALSCLLASTTALASDGTGDNIYIEIFNFVAALAAGATLGHLINKVRNLKSHEKELIESNRISEALSQSVNVLIFANDEEKMVSEISDIICDLQGFDACWVSIFPTPGKIPDQITLDIHKGFNAPAQPFAPTALLESCFQNRESIIQNKLDCATSFPPLKDSWRDKNIKSCGLFPLFIDNDVAGILCVASSNEIGFKKRHQSLLNELANDIGHGLARLRGQKKRMKAEEALRESENHYRSLVEMSPDAILVLDDLDSIVFANKRGHDLFAPENTGNILKTRFPNLIAETEEELQNTALFEKQEPIKTHTSVKLRRLDATTFDADIVSRYVNLDGEQIRLLIIRDVTERNRVNEHLAQSSKLATLGEMAAGITHELSQPLNIIRFAAEGTVLKMKRGAIDMEESRAQFDLISVQCTRMADIIDHMRVFSRKDTGSMEVFDPAVVIRQAVDMVEAQYYAEDVHFEVRYPPYYEKLKGRPIQLEQVLLNLITNARDAINTRQKNLGGEMKELKKIDVTMTYNQADDLVKIFVSDNGGGIPKDALEKLFDPFFTTKEVGKGTGLGLSVSYGIISAMGGTIQVRNIHNGARFEIVLPALATQTQLPAPKPIPQGPQPTLPLKVANTAPELEEDELLELDQEVDGPYVLVVDDEVYAAEGMTELLYNEGYRVNMAGDGVEALELFDAEDIDLVITDVRMPKMDGYELMGQLKSRNPDLPVIVVTGHTGMEDDSQIDLNEQAFCVLKKPVSLSELSEQVKKATENIKKEVS